MNTICTTGQKSGCTLFPKMGTAKPCGKMQSCVIPYSRLIGMPSDPLTDKPADTLTADSTIIPINEAHTKETYAHPTAAQRSKVPNQRKPRWPPDMNLYFFHAITKYSSGGYHAGAPRLCGPRQHLDDNLEKEKERRTRVCATFSYR